MKKIKKILLVLLVFVLSACSNLSKQNVNDGPPQLPEINFGSSLTGFTTFEDDSDKFLILDNSNFVCDASESQTVKLAAIPVNNRVTVLDFVKSINPSRKSAFVMLRFDALTQNYFEYGGNALSSQTDSVINVSSNQFSSTIIPANSVVFLVSPNSFSYCDFGDSTDFTHIPLKSGWLIASVPDGFFDSDVIEVYNALDSSEITMTEESPLEAGMYWFKIDIQDDRLFGDPVVEEPVDPNNGATTQDDDSDLDESDSDSDSSDDQNTEENFNENIPRDFDEDEVPDDQDAFPFDPTEFVDTDGDGTGDNADTDDDGDGVNDNEDLFPLDPTESVDTDGDGTGDNADTDDDNDGILDTDDEFPLVPAEGESGEGDSGEGEPAECDFGGDDSGAVDSSLDTDGDGVFDVDDNCLFVINPSQEDENGFNDGISLGDACEDLVFNLEAAEDENAEFNIEVSCLDDDVLENECNFSIDFGVDLETCPRLGEVDGVSNDSLCDYTLNEQDDITRVNTFTESFEYSTSTATVKISGDVRHLRFSDTSDLKEVVRFGDLNYRSLKGMFNGTSLVSAAGDMDSSNVTDLEATFFSTHELERLEISKWDVGNVTNMSNMFNDLMSLQELDLSCWDVSQVENMETMFQLSKISNLDLSRWNVAELQNAKNMFNSSQADGVYDLSGWEFDATVDTSGMFAYADLSELNLSDWTLKDGATMETVFDTSNIDVLDFSNLAIEGDVNMTAMFGRATITSLDVSEWNSENANSVNMTTLFASADIDNDLLDLSTWKVEKVTNLGNSFLQSTINAVDLSRWNLSSLGSVGFIFMQSNISEFVLDDWTFKDNARINNLFQNSPSVERVSMQNWDFANILSVTDGFWLVSGLNTLDLSGWVFDESDYDAIKNFFDKVFKNPRGQLVEHGDLTVIISDRADWCFIVSEEGELEILSGATFRDSDGAAVNLLDCVGAGDEELDTDLDGVIDDIDNCPLVSNADQNDFDSDGSGDVCDDDIDGDEVNNFTVDGEYLDLCPFTRAPFELRVNADGCLDDDEDGVMAFDIPLLSHTQEDNFTIDNCPFKQNQDQQKLDENKVLGNACQDLILISDTDNSFKFKFRRQLPDGSSRSVSYTNINSDNATIDNFRFDQEYTLNVKAGTEIVFSGYLNGLQLIEVDGSRPEFRVKQFGDNGANFNSIQFNITQDGEAVTAFKSIRGDAYFSLRAVIILKVGDFDMRSFSKGNFSGMTTVGSSNIMDFRFLVNPNLDNLIDTFRGKTFTEIWFGNQHFENFNTAATDPSISDAGMFQGSKIEFLDMKDVLFTNVNSTKNMFYRAQIDKLNFPTKATFSGSLSSEGMFKDFNLTEARQCETPIDLKLNINLSTIRNSRDMFRNACIKSLDLGPNSAVSADLNTAHYMFRELELSSLELGGFANSIFGSHIYGMFFESKFPFTLNLSSINFSNVTNANRMFFNFDGRIDFGENFFINITGTNDMFSSANIPNSNFSDLDDASNGFISMLRMFNGTDPFTRRMLNDELIYTLDLTFINFTQDIGSRISSLNFNFVEERSKYHINLGQVDFNYQPRLFPSDVKLYCTGSQADSLGCLDILEFESLEELDVVEVELNVDES